MDVDGNSCVRSNEMVGRAAANDNLRMDKEHIRKTTLLKLQGQEDSILKLVHTTNVGPPRSR